VCVADSQATILVKGIQAQNTDSSLQVFLANERRNESGPVSGLIINRDLQVAVAAQSCGEQPQSVLYVYGIPANMHSDVIRDYFSNKRNGGGPIDKMDRSDSVTCIHFKQAQGVHILYKYNYLFILFVFSYV
jgi:hypothetical protein